MTRSSSASDPRDKVYGVLGLTTSLFSHDKDYIHADYNKSAVEVFYSTAAYLLESLPSGSALSLVEDLKDRKIQGLQSWVPDLTAQHRAINRTGHGRYWDTGSAVRRSNPLKCLVEGNVILRSAVKRDTVSFVRSPTENLLQDLHGRSNGQDAQNGAYLF